MASQKIQDGILCYLYMNNFQAKLEALSSTLHKDRQELMSNLKPLCSTGYTKQIDSNLFHITSLGIYYVEMHKLVPSDRIALNEKTQLVLLSGSAPSGKDGVTGTLEEWLEKGQQLGSTEEMIKANLTLLHATGLITSAGDPLPTITPDGMKQLNYLKRKYPAAV
jgi:hypothetical protein